MKTNNKQRIIIFLSLTAIVITGLILLYFPKWVVDDAFINFRYRINYLQGKGLVFNDKIRVEGFTSPLQLALLIVSPFDPIFTSHISAIAFYLLSVFFLWKLFNNKVLIAFYLFSPILFVHLFSGLETVMFLSLIIMNIYLFKVNSRFLILGLIFLSLCRPEGILFSLLIIIYKKNVMVPYFIFLISFIVLRFWYYNEIFPNSFYAKLTSRGFKQNLINLGEFIVYYISIPVSLILIARKKKVINSSIVKIALLFTAITLAYYIRSNLVMNYSYRFYFHLYPLALIICDQFIDPQYVRRVIPLIVVQLIIYIFLFKSEFSFASNYKNIIDNIHTKAGMYIHSIVTPTDWMVSNFDAGAIPYYAGCNCIDLGGLNDKVIAKENLDIQQTIDYLFSFQPKVIVMTSYEWDYLKHNERTRLISQDRRFSQYELVKKYGISGTKYYQFIYVEKIK